MDADERNPQQWHVSNSPMTPTLRYGQFFLPAKIGKMTTARLLPCTHHPTTWVILRVRHLD